MNGFEIEEVEGVEPPRRARVIGNPAQHPDGEVDDQRRFRMSGHDHVNYWKPVWSG